MQYIFGLLAITAMAIYPFSYRSSVDEYVVTVESKERIANGSGNNLSHRYLVFTDEGTFEVTDTLLFFDFSSSDRYSRLKDGRTYRIKASGWRVPFLSMYENIIELEES